MTDLDTVINNVKREVIIAIEQPLCDKPHIGIAWLSTKERLQVRKALSSINKSRATKGQQPTNEIPCH